MFYKTMRVVFILVSGLLMLRFAFPKLLAQPVSEETFEMLSQVVPINAKFFMYFTGAVELLIALLLLGSLFLRAERTKMQLQEMGYFLLLSTMIGGLVAEFYGRPEPKTILVTIAIVLITIAVSELSILSKSKREMHYN